ncbi:BREX-2 system phosphatase PglZ [Micromonospora aurantiaca]|uniref:BREX-2 system phosphatase PglZ n=1 Tax=Micromonospora aurantiaca (nom. illeg.) TaxID=47850 RepID=UPI0036611BF2
MITDGVPLTLTVNPAALAQRITRILQDRPLTPAPIILVAAAAHWPYEPVLVTRTGIEFEVVGAESVLAIWEQLVAKRTMPAVILTPVPEEMLGTGLLSRVVHRSVFRMEPWAIIADSFGAQRIDPRLAELRWAGPALLEATPAKGWPPLAGTVLQRDLTLRHLTVERLGLRRLDVEPDDLDDAVLLRWSALPTARQDLDRLTDAERFGLLTWLGETFGPTGRMLGLLAETDHIADLLPLGLLCATLWADPNNADQRAQGRVEQYAGAAHLDPAAMRAYGAAAQDITIGLFNGSDRPLAGRELTPQQVLERAEDLLTMFSAHAAAEHSSVLPTGFDRALAAVAHALDQALGGTQTAVSTAEAAAQRLAGHMLAGRYRHRVQRAEMAVRLLRWLNTPPRSFADTGEAIEAQIAEWSWVDTALEHVWAGDDAHTDLARTYRVLDERVRVRRKALDSAFAEVLARWVRHPAGAWTVESILGKVVEPVVRDGDRGVLLVVLDGMTAAAANELTAELTDNGWQEYDPAGARAAGGARRRGVVSGIPSVTAVSRTSLFTGLLRRGNQDDERAAFEQHQLWNGRTARLFHRNNLYGDAGGVLNADLVAALSEPDTIVGVVINTIDDALDHGRESADAGWRLNQLGVLRTLLEHASYQGRAVILTSDHGHVLDRGGQLRASTDPASARHRLDAAVASDGEVELSGPRVLDGDNRIVALWDEGLRYLPRRAGYHGGASLAEVTVPVIALLPLGATAPPAWRPLGTQEPTWWNASTSPSPSAELPPAAVPEKARKPSRRAHEQGEALFDLTASEPTQAAPDLVEAVLASEMFRAQHALTPRKVPIAKVRGALSALLRANGTLPVVLVAQGAGETATRAGGFVTTLQRIFNVDNFAVLSIIDDGRTARLDLALLRQQFGVSGSIR